MTAPIISATQLATKPYSKERFAAMNRADRITRVMFGARRRGERMTASEAIAYVDAEIDTRNARIILDNLKAADVLAVATDSQAANDASTNSPEPVVMALPATRSDLLALVSDGKVFAAEFIKNDKSLRKMQCRLGVQKLLKGGFKAYDDEAKGILTVFDMKAKGYRSIKIERLTALTVKGQRYAA